MSALIIRCDTQLTSLFAFPSNVLVDRTCFLVFCASVEFTDPREWQGGAAVRLRRECCIKASGSLSAQAGSIDLSHCVGHLPERLSVSHLQWFAEGSLRVRNTLGDSDQGSPCAPHQGFCRERKTGGEKTGLASRGARVRQCQGTFRWPGVGLVSIWLFRGVIAPVR